MLDYSTFQSNFFTILIFDDKEPYYLKQTQLFVGRGRIQWENIGFYFSIRKIIFKDHH